MQNAVFLIGINLQNAAARHCTANSAQIEVFPCLAASRKHLEHVARVKSALAERTASAAGGWRPSL